MTNLPSDNIPNLGAASKFPGLLPNLEALCKFACNMIKVDHSGFVLFEKTLDRGTVVAQFPSAGFENLLGRAVPLDGIEAEQRLLYQEDAIDIEDVDDPKQQTALGSVAELLREFDIKSLYIVRVRVRGEVIGSFSLDRIGQAAGFTAADKELCKSLAELVSLIIENVFLSNWLEVFQGSTKAMISQQEIEPLLETIVKQAVKLLEVEEAGIYERRYDAEGEYLFLSAASDPGAEKIFRREDGGMAWQLMLGNKPFETTSDYSNYEHQARQFKGQQRFGSVLEVPMVWLGEKVGAIYVAGKKGLHFTEFHANRLQRIADFATLTIQRCRLLTRIETLSNASRDFSWKLDSKKSLNERLTTIATYATKILDAEMCGIFRVRDSEIMTLEASVGHREGFFPIGKPFRLIDGSHTGLTGAIAYRLREEHREFVAHHDDAALFRGVVNINGPDLSFDPATKGEPDNSQSGACNSLLAVPLLSIPPATPSVTGLLRVSNKKGADGVSRAGIGFNKEDEWILRIFATAAAVAIETAELFTNREAQFSLYKTFSEVLTGDADLDSRLDELARKMAIVLKKSFCRILFFDDGSQNTWRVRAAAPHPREPVAPHPRESVEINWEPGKGNPIEVENYQHLKLMLKRSVTQVLSLDAPDDSAYLEALSTALRIGQQDNGFKKGLKSLVAIPLAVGPQVVGALEFGELRDPGLGRGRSLQSDLSLAFDSASLTAELLCRDLTRKRELELLNAFDASLERIRRAEDLNTLFRMIIDEARLLLSYDSAGMISQGYSDGPIEIIDAQGTIRFENDRELWRQFEKLFNPATTEMAAPLHKLLSQLGIRSEPANGSLLASKLHYGTQSRCLLFVEREAAPFFQSSVEQEVLDKFARHCSTSLTRAVVRDRLGRTSVAMNQLGNTMAYGDPAEALTNVLSGIMHTTQCDSVILYQIDSRSQEFLSPPHYVGEVHPENIVPVTASLRNTAVGKILAEGKLHMAPDASTDAIMHDMFQEQERVKSSVGAPIWIKNPAGDSTDRPAAQEKVDVGVLFLNYKQPQIFTQAEEQIFSLFAPFVAVAIRNQELYEQEHKKAKIQKALSAAAKSLNRSLDLGETKSRIAEEAYVVAQAAGRKVNFVVLKLLQGDKAYIVSAHPRAEMERIRKELKVENLEVPLKYEDGRPFGIVGRAVQEKRTQLVNNTSADKDYRQVHDDTNSQLVILLPPMEAPIGVISIESPAPNTFYQEDEEIFELFAALAADAIRNAQQYADLAEARVREEAATAIAIADIWAGILAHDLSDDVESIIRAATFLEKDISSKVNSPSKIPFLSRSTKFVRKLYQRTKRKDFSVLVERARKLRDLFPSQKIDYDAFPCIDLEEHLTGWAKDREPKLRNEGITLNYRPALQSKLGVRVHPKLLDRVLDLFLKNGKAAIEQRANKQLTLETASPRADKVEISFSNTGPAVENTTWQKLGVQRVESPTGKGLGVLIACQIIRVCKGEFLKLKNIDGEVTVGIRLPVVNETPVESEP